MTGTIIPLRPSDDAMPALARLDEVAAQLLTEGHATSLSAARIDAILADLYVKRAGLCRLIAELQLRPASGDVRIDAINATLIVEAGKGLAHIDVFIQHTEVCAGSVAVG